MSEMQRSAPDLWSNYQTLASIADFGSEDYNQAYLALDNQVIDIALIEKAAELAVVSADFDWMDIGNFKDVLIQTFLRRLVVIRCYRQYRRYYK